MIDRTTRVQLDRSDVLKVHGHTKIILTNAKTGEKKTIEHDNTFQSAVLQRYMRSLGAANNNPFANSTWAERDIARNLVGGIFLFQNAIESAVEYMPAGNVMVANGSFGVTNAAQPQELGSYNSIESSFGADAITLVYDWGTSQGNGTIGCVCLTSEVGGYIGYGNAGGYYATPISMAQNQSFRTLSNAQWFYNGYKYSFTGFDSSTNTVTLTKQLAGIDTIGLFYGRDAKTKNYVVSGSPYYGGSSDYLYYAKQLTPTKVVLIPSSGNRSLANGNSANFMIYDCESDTISLQPITNTSGSSIGIIIGGNTRQSSVNILGIDAAGNVYFGGSGSTPRNATKFDSSGVFVTEFADTTGSVSGCGTQIAPGLFLTRANSGSLIMIDSINGTAKRTNGVFYDGQSDYFTFTMYPNIDAWTLTGKDSDGNARLIKNPLYLSTINNLPDAVTKDSTQTMKVIYTLTEASA